MQIRPIANSAPDQRKLDGKAPEGGYTFDLADALYPRCPDQAAAVDGHVTEGVPTRANPFRPL